jgi:hypothetical protein
LIDSGAGVVQVGEWHRKYLLGKTPLIQAQKLVTNGKLEEAVSRINHMLLLI